MVEHRILIPRDEKTARDFADLHIDERSNCDVEELSLLQKMEVLRYITARAPGLRPRNGEQGKIIGSEQIDILVQVLAALRKETADRELGRSLDRIRAKVEHARNAGFPVWIFR